MTSQTWKSVCHCHREQVGCKKSSKSKELCQWIRHFAIVFTCGRLRRCDACVLNGKKAKNPQTWRHHDDSHAIHPSSLSFHLLMHAPLHASRSFTESLKHRTAGLIFTSNSAKRCMFSSSIYVYVVLYKSTLHPMQVRHNVNVTSLEWCVTRFHKISLK